MFCKFSIFSSDCRADLTEQVTFVLRTVVDCRDDWNIEVAAVWGCVVMRKSKHSGRMMKWAVLKRNCWDEIHTDAPPDVLPSLPELLGYGYTLCILFNFFNCSYYWMQIYFIYFGTRDVFSSCYLFDIQFCGKWKWKLKWQLMLNINCRFKIQQRHFICALDWTEDNEDNLA